MTAEIITPQAMSAASDAETFLTRMQAVTVTSDAEYKSAGEYLTQIKAKARNLEDLRLGMTRPLDETKKAIMDFFRKPADFLERAEKSVKAVMLTYHRQQEEMRRQAEEQFRREAEEKRRAAEEERRKAEEELRLKSAEAEELRRKAESEAAAGNLNVAAIAQMAADATAQEGIDNFRGALLNQRAVDTEIEASVAAVVPPPPKAYGTSVRKNWKARVLDPNAVPREFLTIDDKKLGEYARTMKDQAKVPGVEFYAEDSLASR